MNVVIFYFLSVASLALFLYGFFPMQNNVTGKETELPTSLGNVSFDINKLYRKEIDRLVLVVIDALRYDFVTTDNMPFLTSATKSHGCLLNVQVESPTVTLPRIKALTTGNVPQFVDVIWNLASTEVLTDSLLHKARNGGKKLIFYGDDTWITLFPDIFSRYEGVSSFYINDFTEVDNNVTRNLLTELNRNDWDVMILHYLGLDHIGHKFGPASHFVGPKLKEMDEIISNIFLSSQGWNKTLIAVTGDHGMKDTGGHGGASYGETHVPFAALGIACKDDIVAQVDLPITLSSLMGLKIPAHNIGRVIGNMLTSYSLERFLYILHYNVLVLQAKIKEYEGIFHQASVLHYNFLRTKNQSLGIEAQKLYQHCAMKLSDRLIELSVKQNVACLLIGILFLIFSFCVVIYKLYNEIDCTSKFLVYGNFIYLVSLVSSSFVEEEHQIWYFWCSAYLITVFASDTSKMGIVVVLLVLRVCRNMNQTGDKWAHLPDVAQWLILKENYFYHQLLLSISLILTWLCFAYFVRGTLVLGLHFTTLFCIFLFHTFQISFIGKLIWLLIVCNIIAGFGSVNFLLISWVSYTAFLMRAHNVILLPCCLFSSIIISKHVKNITELTLFHIWLGRMYFFCQGHSNSLASVDVASGYAGLQEYMPIIVMIQVLCHTYAFPILTVLLILRTRFHHYRIIWEINILIRTSVIIIISFVILIHIHHLFVWTVFAPKLLFEFSHSIVLMFQIVLFYGLKVIKENSKYYLKKLI